MVYPTRDSFAALYGPPRPAAPMPHNFRANPNPPVPRDSAQGAAARAVRDAAAPHTTLTQRMAATYAGDSSRTIPQSSLARIHQLAERSGIEPAAARRFVDGFLALGDEPTE